MLRSSLLVVAILIAGAGAVHAQVSDPQAVSSVVYSGTPNVSPNCAGDAYDASSPDCVPGGESRPVDQPAIADYPPDYDYDYVPDYWDTAPAYAAAPPFYLGISLYPDYWGWPYYPYGWGYGWPYYGYAAFGFGYAWPYYGYCCYWGGYWNSYAWHDHGHHGHDHGGWGDHGGHGHWDGHGGSDHAGWDHGGGGHGTHGYPGPYRYLGHGQYANLPGSGGSIGGRGDGPMRVASTEPAKTNQPRLAATRAAPNNGNAFADVRASSRVGAFTSNPGAGQGRFAGRAVLPSASYAAAARSAGNMAFAGNRAATNYRGSTAAGYGYGRGNGGSASAANEGYRVTASPNRGYASANYVGSRQSMARSGVNVPPLSYSGRVAPSYPQQRYATGNRIYARGAPPSYSAARGPMPSYSYSGRGAMPSYARGGSYSAPHAGNGIASAPRGGGNGHSGGHASSSHGR